MLFRQRSASLYAADSPYGAGMHLVSGAEWVAMVLEEVTLYLKAVEVIVVSVGGATLWLPSLRVRVQIAAVGHVLRNIRTHVRDAPTEFEWIVE